MVVTVVRGHTERVTMTFERGEASPPLSVGSRGEWQVSGPGVMPIHLWLSFDGQRLFAASGEAAAHLRGRPLSNEYSPLDDGAELRFGFALLRVSHGAPPAAHGKRGRAGARRQRLLQAVGAAALLVVAIVGASLFALRRSSPESAAAPTPSASGLAQAPPPPAELPAAASPVLPQTRPRRQPKLRPRWLSRSPNHRWWARRSSQPPRRQRSPSPLGSRPSSRSPPRTRRTSPIDPFRGLATNPG